MANQSFLATGQVIDSSTTEGLPDVRVEAWANIQNDARLLSSAQTDVNGRFIIDFSFNELNLANAPDCTFKVFHDDQFLRTSEDSVLWNANSQEDITIHVLPPETRPAGKDRITVNQVFKVSDFLKQSDFSGLLTETRGKARTNWDFVTSALSNSFRKFDLKPVGVKGPQVGDIIGQDSAIAARNLRANHITVHKVVDYNPGVNRESLSNLFAFPVALKPGQAVELHQDQEGKVRYYSIIKNEDNAQPPSPNNFAPENTEIRKLKEELKITTQHAAKKDAQILKLQEEIKTLRQGQDEIKKMLTGIRNADKPLKKPSKKT